MIKEQILIPETLQRHGLQEEKNSQNNTENNKIYIVNTNVGEKNRDIYTTGVFINV